jgi:autoinducer 2-degrading protein
MDAMFAILFRALAKPGKSQELFDFLKRNSQHCDDHEEGNLRFDVLRDPENENAFYVYEVYKDDAAFQAHKNNPPFIEWDKKVKDESVALYVELFKGKPECVTKNPRSLAS